MSCSGGCRASGRQKNEARSKASRSRFGAAAESIYNSREICRARRNDWETQYCEGITIPLYGYIPVM